MRTISREERKNVMSVYLILGPKRETDDRQMVYEFNAETDSEAVKSTEVLSLRYSGYGGYRMFCLRQVDVEKIASDSKERV